MNDRVDRFTKKRFSHIWHPCSQMKDYETLRPIIVDHAKGPYLYAADGTEYLDIISSWWCNLLGHCNPKINAAIKEQIEQLEHVIFVNFTHEPAIKLCEELVDVLPKGLNKFNFADNGSSSVEIALKSLSNISCRPVTRKNSASCASAKVITVKPSALFP